MSLLLAVVVTTAGTLAFSGPTGTRSTTPSTAAAPVAAAAYAHLTSPERRVRAAHERVKSLIETGFYRSPTFASLLTALADTDVIVYIESVMTLPKDTMGHLSMVPVEGEHRYLRIKIRSDLPEREAIALIGHEMQHALEIAGATDVRNLTDLIKLYRRIGHSSGPEHAFDTQAAQDTGRQVLRELRG